MLKALGLFYVLVTAAILSRLLVNRFVGAAWGATAELFGVAAIVSLAEVPVLLLLRKARAVT